MKEKKRVSKFQLFMIGFAGLVLCTMCALMYASGTVDLTQFFSNGEICELSQADLRASASSMIYNRELQRYDLTRKVCRKKYIPTAQTSCWRYVCVTITNMSASSIEGSLVCYNKAKEEVQRIPVNWVWGENHILLDDTIPVYGVGVEFRGAKGGYVTIDSIQLRSGDSVFEIEKLIKAFAVCYVLFLMLVFLYRSVWRIRREKTGDKENVLTEVIGGIYQEIGIFWENHILKGKRPALSGAWAETLYCILFAGMLLGNIYGWYEDADCYRYHMLICCVILLAIAGICWEHTERKAVYRKQLLYTWIALWGWEMLSNLFVTAKTHRTGFVMLFAGGIFLYVWGRMSDPGKMYGYMIRGLEMTFAPVVICCILFREKQIDVQYNGMFMSSEAFAMYTALMAAVFLTELLRILQQKTGWYIYVLYGAGLGISVYFLRITENMPGMIGFGLTCVICIGYMEKKHMGKIVGLIRRQWWKYILALALSVVCVMAVKGAVSSLPGFLDSQAQYQEEQLLTKLSAMELEERNASEEAQMPDVVSVEQLELPVVWKSYLWKVNLFGHGTELEVFRERAYPYNSYLEMVYRYGMPVIVPYIGFQLTLLGVCAGNMIKKKQFWRGETIGILTAAVTVIYLCFCVWGNPDLEMAHPLWFLFFVGNGILLLEGERENG